MTRQGRSRTALSRGGKKSTCPSPGSWPGSPARCPLCRPGTPALSPLCTPLGSPPRPVAPQGSCSPSQEVCTPPEAARAVTPRVWSTWPGTRLGPSTCCWAALRILALGPHRGVCEPSLHGSQHDFLRLSWARPTPTLPAPPASYTCASAPTANSSPTHLQWSLFPSQAPGSSIWTTNCPQRPTLHAPSCLHHWCGCPGPPALSPRSCPSLSPA